MSDVTETLKVKAWGKGQGEFVEINKADFDPEKHEKYNPPKGAKAVDVETDEEKAAKAAAAEADKKAKEQAKAEAAAKKKAEVEAAKAAAKAKK